MDKDFAVGLVVTVVAFLIFPSASVFDGAMFVFAFLVNCIIAASLGVIASTISYVYFGKKRKG